MTRRIPRRVALPTLVAWAIFATYALAARGVHNFFPLSVFDMYQGTPPEVVARVMVVDDRGRTKEITDYVSFRCAPTRPVLDLRERCGRPVTAVPYVLRDQQIHLDAHLGGGGSEHVQIVARFHRLSGRADAAEAQDCMIAECTARGDGGRR